MRRRNGGTLVAVRIVMAKRAYVVTGNEVVDLVRSTGRALDAELEARLQPFGLRLAGLVFLRTLVRSAETLTVTTLANATGSSKQHTSAMVTRLVCAGLAEARKGIGRTLEITATPRGHEAVAAADDCFTPVTERVADALTPRERGAVARGLAKVRAAVRVRNEPTQAAATTGGGDRTPWLDGYIARVPVPPPKRPPIHTVDADEWQKLREEDRHAHVMATILKLTPRQRSRYVRCPTTFYEEWSATGEKPSDPEDGGESE